MNIAIDATPLVSGQRAVKRHTKNLIHSLWALDMANQYSVFFLDWKNCRRPDLIYPDERTIQEIRIPFPGRLLVPSWRYLAIPKAEWMIGKVDILYATDLYFPPLRRGIVLGTIRGIGQHIIKAKLIPEETRLLLEGLQFTLKHADYLLAVSAKTREELIEHFDIPQERIFVVPHGIDPCFYQMSDRQQVEGQLMKNFGLRPPYILYVGVIGHHKNIRGLLQAYEIIRGHGFDLPLVLAGPVGSAWQDAHDWAYEKGLEKCIHFLGSIDQTTTDLTILYNGASLFVFPSFYEGCTAPPVEAMACGTPVITSNVSSLPERVGNAALQVDPEDIEELAHQMEQVLDDESLSTSLISRGLTHAATHTWEAAGKKFLKVFEDIHQRGPRNKTRV